LLALVACAPAASPRWSAPAPIDLPPSGDVESDVALGMDDAGDAVAVWRRARTPGAPFDVQAARFDQATRTWSAPTPLETDDVDPASDADLAVEGAGHAVVVWSQLSAGAESIWSSWLEAGAGTWHSATLVEIDDTGDAQKARVAALPDGGAWAVWYQWDGLRQSVWANRLVPPAWGERSLLETTDSADAIEPDVAADPAGNAVAVWTETDGSLVTVWSSRRAADDAAWEAPFMLGVSGVDDGTHTPAPHVALDARGDGVAVWSLSTGGAWTVWVSRYRGDTGTWEAAAPLQPDDGGDSTGAQLALDANGDAYATWRRQDGASFSVWAARFVARSGAWTAPVPLDDLAGDAVGPSVAAAGDGQAVVVWQQRAGVAGVRASRFDPKSGTWGAPLLLDADGPTAQAPRVAVDAWGTAVAIWARRQGGSYDLLAAHQSF
jgi:hypothetical protein